MSRIVVIDNFDSFTYNLVHLLEAISQEEIDVFRTDRIDETGLDPYEFVIFSPGPGLPEERKELLCLVQGAMRRKKATLGVCLGHQALAVTSGAKLKNLATVHHGVAHGVFADPSAKLFKGLPDKFQVGRYHSWVVSESELDADWRVTCRDEAGEIMAMEHNSLPFYGVQFHPESVLSPDGKQILRNFMGT